MLCLDNALHKLKCLLCVCSPDSSGGPHGKDEEDDNQPYNPQYESLPAPRPMRPPEYKPTPEYPSSVATRTPVPYGGSMMEMQKVSNTDLSKAHMFNYNSTSALTTQVCSGHVCNVSFMCGSLYGVSVCTCVCLCVRACGTCIYESFFCACSIVTMCCSIGHGRWDATT